MRDSVLLHWKRGQVTYKVGDCVEWVSNVSRENYRGKVMFIGDWYIEAYDCYVKCSDGYWLPEDHHKKVPMRNILGRVLNGEIVSDVAVKEEE